MTETTPSDRLTEVAETSEQVVYYNGRRGTYHTWYDQDDYEPVTTAILMAVASLREVDPVELESLNDVIDPDALNELFVHWNREIPRSGGGSVSFSFAGYEVTIQSDGEIVLEEKVYQI